MRSPPAEVKILGDQLPPATPLRIPAVPFDCALVGARVPGESGKTVRPADSESLDSKDGALSPLASRAWPMRNPGLKLWVKVWVAGRKGGRAAGRAQRPGRAQARECTPLLLLPY